MENDIVFEFVNLLKDFLLGLGQLQDMTLYNNLLNMIMRHSRRSRIIKKIGIRSEGERQDSIYVIWYWIGYLGDVV